MLSGRRRLEINTGGCLNTGVDEREFKSEVDRDWGDDDGCQGRGGESLRERKKKKKK